MVVGPGVGRDAALVRFDHRILVLSTDPITGAKRHIGKHAVHVNANDVAVAGGKPLWFLLTIMMPPGTRESDLKGMMQEVDVEARKLGVSVVRGHTEVTPGIKHPIIAGFMIGESDRQNKQVTADRAREGDSIVLTKTAGIEGTAVLASDHAELLEDRGIDSATIHHARKFLNQISIVPEARIASKMRGVNAMHDPTEGGVLNGLWELAEASNVGVEIDADLIPVARETRQVGEALKLDPLKLLGSGSLLISCRSSSTRKLLSSLGNSGITATCIGRITERDGERHFRREGRTAILTPVYRDELYKL